MLCPSSHSIQILLKKLQLKDKMSSLQMSNVTCMFYTRSFKISFINGNEPRGRLLVCSDSLKMTNDINHKFLFLNDSLHGKKTKYFKFRLRTNFKTALNWRQQVSAFIKTVFFSLRAIAPNRRMST